MKRSEWFTTLGIGSAVAIVGLVAVACGQAATPTPTATPRPVVTPTPTATPRAATTPTPTSAAAPTATATPRPVATPTPTATAMAANQPKRGGVLRLLADGEFAGFDAQGVRSGQIAAVMSQVSIKPVRQDESPTADQTKRPFANEWAENWRVESPTRYVYKLKSGVMLPGVGREAEAADIKWSYDRMVAKKSPYLGNEMSGIASLEVVDKYTVAFNLKEPSAEFFDRYAGNYSFTVFKDYLDPTADGLGSMTSILKHWKGPGYMQVKDYQPGVSYELERNPNYLKPGLPRLDGLKYLIFKDRSASLAAFLTGQLDIRVVTIAEKATVTKNLSSAQLRVVPPASVLPTHMDLNNPPMNNVNFRRAMSMAIDRDAWLKARFEGEGAIVLAIPPVFGKVALQLKDLPPNIAQWYKYDPEAARKLLQAGGYKDASITIQGSSERYVEHGPSLDLYKAFWDAVGINTKVLDYPYAQHQASGVPVGGIKMRNITRQNLSPFTWEIFHPSVRFTGADKPYIDPATATPEEKELISLLEQWQVEPDAAKRDELLYKAQLIILDQVLILYPPAGNAITAMQSHVRDYNPAHSGDGNGAEMWAWLDK